MKRIICLLLLVLMTTGCAAVGKVGKFRATNRYNLSQLSVGITKEEALKTMEIRKILTADEIITNPYRSEILQGEYGTLEVLYYYTDLVKMDGTITNDELTPVVFDSEELIGWGWTFFKEAMSEYGVR